MLMSVAGHRFRRPPSIVESLFESLKIRSVDEFQSIAIDACSLVQCLLVCVYGCVLLYHWLFPMASLAFSANLTGLQGQKQTRTIVSDNEFRSPSTESSFVWPDVWLSAHEVRVHGTGRAGEGRTKKERRDRANSRVAIHDPKYKG